MRTNDAKCLVKRKAHKIDEKICEETDKTCFAKKVKNRAVEGEDCAKGKASEVVNVIGDDGKTSKKSPNRTKHKRALLVKTLKSTLWRIKNFYFNCRNSCGFIGFLSIAPANTDINKFQSRASIIAISNINKPQLQMPTNLYCGY